MVEINLYLNPSAAEGAKYNLYLKSRIAEGKMLVHSLLYHDKLNIQNVLLLGSTIRKCLLRKRIQAASGVGLGSSLQRESGLKKITVNNKLSIQMQARATCFGSLGRIAKGISIGVNTINTHLRRARRLSELDPNTLASYDSMTLDELGFIEI